LIYYGKQTETSTKGERYMKKIRVELAERSYDIAVGSNIMEGVGERLLLFSLSPKISLISNPTVFALYGERVTDSIKKAGFDLNTIILPDGEEYKDIIQVQHIYDELLKQKLDRSSGLIALGGGVIGDITGFAASTYMRGISYIQVPTTLLAQVDSSVGGKTGVNHRLGKNMIGTFWQPGLVWIDIGTLKSLPKRQLLAGLAEVIKYGVIYDRELFVFLELNRGKILNLDNGAIMHIIKRSCEIKADIVSKDEREGGLRAVLNYGHTIGHAIETVTGYTRYLHGEGVAIGMYLEARLSQLLGLVDQDQVLRIKTLLESYGLPSALPDDIDKNNVLLSMQLDKKTVAGKLKFILPETIGKARIEKKIPEKVVMETLTV
jgi:3-dehydroquinate synthase